MHGDLRDAADYLTEYQARLQQDAEELGNPSAFSIGIEYSLALTKKTADADITLASGASGAATKLIEVPKDPGIRIAAVISLCAVLTHTSRREPLRNRCNEAMILV